MEQVDVKIVILGNKNVGKTCIAKRYVEGNFSAESKTTIAAAFMTKRVVIDKHKLRLQIWDTAGQERFRSMAPMYYRGASAAILVYDVTNGDSFDAVKDWVKELNANIDEEVVLVIAGNKVDLEDHRVVEVSTATDYATSVHAAYFETSAKENKNIDAVFSELSKRLVSRPNLTPVKPKEALPPPPQKKSCC